MKFEASERPSEDGQLQGVLGKELLATPACMTKLNNFKLGGH